MAQEPIYVYNFGNDDIGEGTITVQKNNSIQIRDQFGLHIVLPIDENIGYDEIDANIYVIIGRNISINNIVIRNILTIRRDDDRATIEFGLEINQGLQDGIVTVEVARDAVDTLQEIALALYHGDEEMPFGYQPLADEVNAPPADLANEQPIVPENAPPADLENGQPIVPENAQPANQQPVVLYNNNSNNNSSVVSVANSINTENTASINGNGGQGGGTRYKRKRKSKRTRKLKRKGLKK